MVLNKEKGWNCEYWFWENINAKRLNNRYESTNLDIEDLKCALYSTPKVLCGTYFGILLEKN